MKKLVGTLVGSSFVIGALSLALVSGYWDAATDRDFFFFPSLVGVFLGSSFLGARHARRFRNPSLTILFELSILLCLWLGVSVSLTKFGLHLIGAYGVIPLLIIGVTGFLVGHFPRLGLSPGAERYHLLKMSGLLTFLAVLGEHYLAQSMGPGWTCVLLSYTWLSVLLILLFSSRIRHGVVTGLCLLSIFLPYTLYQSSVLPKMNSRELSSGRGPQVLLHKQSWVQTLTLTEQHGVDAEFPDLPEHSLYLNSQIRFSSLSEQSDQMCLANIPGAASKASDKSVERVLILGGGTGLTARNVLLFPQIKHIDVVESDPEVLALGRTHPKLTLYNLDSLSNEKVHVSSGDFFQWLQHQTNRYDLILVDIPTNRGNARYFTVEFYRKLFALLEPGGFISVRAGKEVEGTPFAFIGRTLEELDRPVHAYQNAKTHAWYLIVSPEDFDFEDFASRVGIRQTPSAQHFCVYKGPENFKEGRVLSLLNSRTTTVFHPNYAVHPAATAAATR